LKARPGAIGMQDAAPLCRWFLAANAYILPPVYGALWVLLLSGILGFRMGLLNFPDWQVAVETAQVVAGIVQYPANNVFYIYHTKLWTSLHHVLALGLLTGADELTLSLAVSGVMGMLTFQALGMFVYALSRDVLLSVGAAALVFFTRAAEFGVVYPVFLLGTEHTYGTIGLSLSVLVAGLLGAGWYRTGAVLLGVAPSIHPSLGVWAGTIVALAIASDFRRLRDELRPAVPWFLAGCSLTLLSLLIQYIFIYDPPQGMARLSTEDLATFVRVWDGHRSSINLWHNGVLLNAAAAVVACLWLVFFSGKLPSSSRFLLRISAASSLLALVLIPLSWISPDRLPTALLVLMPGRFLNFSVMTFAALLIGLAGSRRDIWNGGVLLLVICGLLACDRSMLWEFLEHHHGIRHASSIPPLGVMTLGATALLAGAVREMWRYVPAGAADHGPADRLRQGSGESRRSAFGAEAEAGHYLRPSLRTGNVVPVYVGAIVVLALVVLMTLHQVPARSGAHFNDRTNDVFFADVAGHSGLLVVAGDLHLMQLRTRRPLLADSGALDTVMYSLETGGEMRRIMTDVYGLDWSNPPPDAVGSGRIPPDAHRKAWESYSPEKWREIRRVFGVTQVIAYANWSLNLPLAAQSRRLLLYDIPGP
jgi:hypothetical protein